MSKVGVVGQKVVRGVTKFIVVISSQYIQILKHDVVGLKSR